MRPSRLVQATKAKKPIVDDERINGTKKPCKARIRRMAPRWIQVTALLGDDQNPEPGEEQIMPKLVAVVGEVR